MFDRLHMKNVQQYLRLPIDTSLKCSIGNVTFQPGYRNNWHKHSDLLLQ